MARTYETLMSVISGEELSRAGQSRADQNMDSVDNRHVTTHLTGTSVTRMYTETQQVLLTRIHN